MTKKTSLPIDLSFLRSRAALRRVAFVAGALAAAGVAYAFLAPRWYRAAVTVVPVKAQRLGGLSSMLGGDLAGLAAGIEGAAGGGADVQRISAVLQGIAVSDAVIEKFGLKERYGASTPEAARERLWEHCDVRVVPKPGLVQLSCEDREPQRVQAMLGYFIDVGNQVFARVNVSSATEEAKFLERRVAELRRQADEAAARMREFQEKHQIVDLESQAKALVSSVALLHGQRTAKRMELGYARGFTSADEPGTRALESQLSVVDDALRELEEPSPSPRSTTSGRAAAGRPGILPPAQDVPRLRSEFEKLYRDRKVAETTLIFALDRLEGAKANEARDVSTFQILDPPTVPTRKSRPKGAPTVLLFAAVGVAVGVALEWWRSRKSNVA